MNEAPDAAAAPRIGRRRLFVVLGALYLAQAIPGYLLVAALPPILRESGVSRTEIGLLGILMMPLVLKFLWAPLVDRLRPFARAQRAGWVVITQAGTVLCLFSLLLVQPTDIPAILVIGFLISMLASTQDIATDGYAAKHLAPEDRGIGNAIQGGSVAVGVVIGGTLGLLLYEAYGWPVMVSSIAVISLLPLVAAFMMQEGPPAPVAAALRPSLRAFLRRREARDILWIALLYRASEGLVKTLEGAYLVDAGVPLWLIGYVSGLSAASAGLVGSALAAVMVQRRGLSFTLSTLGGARTLCFLLFSLHAAGLVTGFVPLFGAAGFQTLIRYMEVVALYSLFMAVTSSEQPGTDFTVLVCAQLIIYMLGSLASGRIADAFGYVAVFGLATLLSGVAVAGTVALLKRAHIGPRRAAAAVPPA